MCLDIRGALNNLKGKRDSSLSYASDDDGKPLTNAKFREMLYDELSKGYRVLPIGDCDNFDYQKGCRGHDVVLLVHDYEFEEGNG